MTSVRLDPIDEVISDYSRGRMVVIVDDPDRENEGDLACPAQLVTPEQISFMMKYARGLICISLSPDIAKRVKLPLQTANNNSPYQTAFTVSVSLKSEGAHTASGRVRTMQALLRDDSCAEDFVSPGSVSPLIADSNGVVGRRGQTEASSDLARISGLAPSGVICEIMADDGSMLRGASLQRYSEKHNLKITSVDEIVRYRREREVFVREVSQAALQTDYGPCRAHVFVDDVARKEHLAVLFGEPNVAEAPLVRIHSECLTGDVLGSRRCDCGPQLDRSIAMMCEEGNGILLYLRQEGRGIGLLNKIRAYELQDHGKDTVDANVELGFEPDQRDYLAAANMLRTLGLKKVQLLTNNPKKVAGLTEGGIEVVDRISVKVDVDPYSEAYLSVKKERMGHLL